MSSVPSEGPLRTERLLRWYGLAARDLPWRRTNDPYRIWISEIMLQQTQVATVLGRYDGWLVRFPDIRALARAHEDEVMKAWEGLGYYRRARFIHTAARRIMAKHHGAFPRQLAEIMALPGIGRSTAGAIASFCFGARTPVLDANVRRVLRRWHGRAEAEEQQLWAWARQAIDATADAAAWNQAMMELGATICTGRRPSCHTCPVAEGCASAYCPEKATARVSPARVRDVFWQVALHMQPERGIWLTRRPAPGIWAGLWTPPITPLQARPDTPACHVHCLTHRRLHLYGQVCTAPPAGPGRWVADLYGVAMPTGMRRLLQRHGIEA